MKNALKASVFFILYFGCVIFGAEIIASFLTDYGVKAFEIKDVNSFYWFLTLIVSLILIK